MNHSCDPNVIINVENADDMYFEARRDIAKDEKLGFFYPSTEVIILAPALGLIIV
jgi:SET domain-containing protein